MSELMVAISKELRDQIVSDYKWSEMNPELQEALRAAPETVSLEGVQRYERDWSEETKQTEMFPVEVGAWVKFSDLRHLVAPDFEKELVFDEKVVSKSFHDAMARETKGEHGFCHNCGYKIIAPVQSSAVVSREGVVELMRKVYAIDGVSVEMAAQVAKIYIDSLATFPVAPVKIGGMELSRVVEKLEKLWDNIDPDSMVGEQLQDALNDLSHLTTTQRAIDLRYFPANIASDTLDRASKPATTQSDPSVGSVPSAWIPVTETLPGYDEEVLVWCGWTMAGVHKPQKVKREADTEFWVSDDFDITSGYDSKRYFTPIFNVTHWQPLPEPPALLTRHMEPK